MQNSRPAGWYQRRSPRQKTALALLVYLVGFGVIALAHALPFLRQQAYFIWSADAYTQHFPAYCFIQDYLRQTVQGVLAGDLRPAMFHFSLGLGGDIWNTLNYYGLGNPFYLLGLLFPAGREPLAFSLILEVQFLLGGLAFYALARKLGAVRWGAVVGGWLYALSGFLPMSVQHPILAHAVVFLPLLLLGAEQVLRRENPLLLGITVFLMGLCGFYFLFISSVVLAFYILLRTWQRRQGGWWPALWRGILRCLAVYLAGLLLSCAIFLPQILAFFQSSRSGSGAVPALFGGWTMLKQWLYSALMPAAEPFVGCLGLLALVLAAAGVAHRKKDAGVWAVGAVIGLVFVASPFAQSALIGFGDSPYTRFWYALALLFGLAFALHAQELFCLGRWQAIAAGVLILLAVLAGVRGPALGFLIAAALVLALCQQGLWNKKGEAAALRARRLGAAALAVLTVGNLAWGLNAQASALPQGSYRNQRFARLMPAVTGDTLPEGEYRVDVAEVADHQWWASSNAALVGGYKGLSEYFSILSGDYTNAMLHDWALAPAQQGSFSFQSLDGCAALNALAGVRYLFARPGMESYAPFGYTYVGETPQSAAFTFVPDPGAQLLRYENQYALPLAYRYDTILHESEYEALNGLQKQAALMQCAAASHTGPQAQPDLSGVQPLEFTHRDGAGMVWQQGMLECTAQEGDALTLTFDAPARSEIHLLLGGFAQQPDQPEVWVSFRMEGGCERRVRMSDAVDPQQTWVNLGYCEAGGPQTVEIRLPRACTLQLEQLEVWSYGMDDFARDAAVRMENGLENIVVGKNSIQGLSREGGFVVFSVPWSSGWSASIDGIPAPAVRANSMFVGLSVPEGDHAVRLYYTTPGFKLGLVCSALGFLALAAQWALWLHGKKKNPKESR